MIFGFCIIQYVTKASHFTHDDAVKKDIEDSKTENNIILTNKI